MKHGNKTNSIALKLVSGFMVVIILIVLLGGMSYNRSSSAMSKSYEQNMTGTVATTATYLELGMSQVTAEAQKIIDNVEFYNYYRGTYKDDGPREYMLWASLYNTVQSAAGASDFISSITVIGDYGDGISSSGSLDSSFYATFQPTVPENTEDGVWIASHPELDEILHIEQSRYAASYVQSFVNFNGYVIIDVNTKAITNVLGNLELDDGIIMGYISADGTEILNAQEEENVFSGKDFFQKAAETGTAGSSMIKIGRTGYMFVYSPIGGTGASVCCLVPERVILSQAYTIRNITIGITIAAIAIALIIALFLALNIQKAISSIVGVLEKAANGDLTKTADVKRRDEFGSLSSSTNSMISNMKVLLDKVNQISSLVQDSSNDVTQTSEMLVSTSDEMCNVVADIESGAVSQAEEAEKCLEQMAGLSDKINTLSNNTSVIEQISHDTKSYVSRGIDIMTKLNQRSKDTQEITAAVIDGINKLNDESKSIESIVEVISSISDQTSLLSLNASIEAARAGDSGKGFAVVADEIRKLADESMQAVSGISDIITRINTQTELTVETARQAGEIVDSQQEALATTIEVFHDINTHVENLADNLDGITNGISQMSAAKDETLSAIQSISRVSDQSASATTEVSATIANQLDAVKSLNANAMTLTDNAKDLLDAVAQFKLE